MSTFQNNFDSIEKLIFEENVKIKAVHFHQDLDLMLCVLSTGKVLKNALSDFPKLKGANENALKDIRLIGEGVGIHWENLDEDISLKYLLSQELKSVTSAA